MPLGCHVAAVDALAVQGGPLEAVTVADLGPGRGRGLRTRRAVDCPGNGGRQDAVLRDEPLVKRQTTSSELRSSNCAHCLRFVGDLEHSLRRVLRCCDSDLEDFPEVLEHPDLRHPRLHDVAPAPVLCSVERCRAVFCSEGCRDRELEVGSHRILCREMRDSGRRGKWADFVAHAQKNDEVFLLAGKAYAQVIASVVSSACSAAAAMQWLLRFEQHDYHALWKESGAAKARLHVMRDSLELLRAALLPAYDDPALGLESLFEVGFYAALLGQFYLVNVSIDFPSPFDGALREPELESLRAAMDASGLLARVREVSDRIAAEGGDEPLEAEELLPPFVGLGLYGWVALTNHACEPNCAVDYHGNATLELVPLRALSAGEELTICYVDKDLGFSDRQAALEANYRFQCSCERCRVEKADLALRRCDGDAVLPERVAEEAGVTVAVVERVRAANRRREDAEDASASDGSSCCSSSSSGSAGRRVHEGRPACPMLSDDSDSDEAWCAAPRVSRSDASRVLVTATSTE
eukprot:TRINITY_DN20872_c0_g3_i1.p1 TRINITY_DN20872_c0_g3~~TRINITY_DN20872_c0_g3_i1.p1  ORF type:complete len:523 (-),score=99.83 TRINITY_DN20872_c0_g3_i1:8-1576(-)